MGRKAFGTGKNYMSMRNESMLIWILKHTSLVTGKETKAWMIRTKYEFAHSLSINSNRATSFISIVTK